MDPFVIFENFRGKRITKTKDKTLVQFLWRFLTIWEKMGSRALLMLSSSTISAGFSFNLRKSCFPVGKKLQNQGKIQLIRNYSTEGSSLEPPDVPRLAETARISLNRDEVISYSLFIFWLILYIYICKFDMKFNEIQEQHLCFFKVFLWFCLHRWKNLHLRLDKWWTGMWP